MLHNPHAVPPSPQDYLPQPTYAVRRIDRDLSSYLASRTAITESFISEIAAKEAHRAQEIADRAAAEPRIPKTLKERVKKGHLTQPFLKGLEEDIREFVVSATVPVVKEATSPVDREILAKAAMARRDGLKEVFTETKKPSRTIPSTEQYLLEKEIEIIPDSEKAEAFSRWIVYQIAEYYRLSCYSEWLLQVICSVFILTDSAAKIIDERRIPCVVLSVEGNTLFSEIPRAIWTYV